MRPVTTFIRHKGIVGVLAVSRLIKKITKGAFPRFLFMAKADLTEIGSRVKVIEEDETSVTVAKFRPDGSIDDGEFRIMTATDMHMDSGGEEKNDKSIERLVRQIRDNKPDLVIFTGDVIQSDCQQIDCVQLSLMMEKLGVYWAYVFGNHEAREEKGFYKYLMYKGLQYYPHCLSRFGRSDLFGYGNFAIHIKNGENSLLKSLFLFDSGRDIQDSTRKEYSLSDEMRGYDFIKRGQIEWYLAELKKVQSRYRAGRSLTFMHIPVKEYENVFCGDEKNGFVPSDKARLLYGTQYESVGSSPFNSGFFEKAAAEGSLQAMFSGHDHINDFCALYKDVYLVYTQCSGYNTYSMEDKAGWDEKDCHYGVTLTTLHPDGEITVEQKKHSVYL